MANRTIPQTLAERRRLRQLAHDFVSEKALHPPVMLSRLEALAAEFVRKNNLDEGLRDWLMVEIHNAVWLPMVASIPYSRRLLLLPKCLRDSKRCEGEMDDLGLLCHRCERCVIPDLQTQADHIGMLSMVAEGFTSVIELIRQHVVDAVIGISCLDSLEKAFPLLVSHAVPGIAVALNDGGCKDTHVDTDYVAQLLSKRSEETMMLLDYDSVREEVDRWFEPEALATVLTPARDTTTKAALEWMLCGGSRWRPFLLAAVYAAIKVESRKYKADSEKGKVEEQFSIPDEVMRAAIAVECFHKASLVHDDIQDKDEERYGQPTVHARYGEAMAINIGDLLLGEGYRLLASLPNKELLGVVANAHVSLCLGQGAELSWQSGQPVTIEEVLQIFRQKTVPAFEVALSLGLLSADGDEHTAQKLHDYSEALGIAYQLKDDMSDIDSEHTAKPSAVYALRQQFPGISDEEIRDNISAMVEEYQTRALASLAEIDSFELKRLLFQATERILRN
jgi:geranylgeranyl pyrophosphate synthase